MIWIQSQGLSQRSFRRVIQTGVPISVPEIVESVGTGSQVGGLAETGDRLVVVALLSERDPQVGKTIDRLRSESQEPPQILFRVRGPFELEKNDAELAKRIDVVRRHLDKPSIALDRFRQVVRELVLPGASEEFLNLRGIH
nr:hypothetical protein [Fimbriiglobus ruber]